MRDVPSMSSKCHKKAKYLKKKIYEKIKRMTYIIHSAAAIYALRPARGKQKKNEKAQHIHNGIVVMSDDTFW